MEAKNKQRSAVAGLVLAASTLVGIALSEGYRSDAYIPIPGDVPTLGFGETKGVKLGDKTTPQRAMVQLLASAESHAQGVRNCVKVPLYPHEFESYTSLAYNIGTGAFCGSTLVRRLNEGQYAAACAELLRWNRAGGRVVAGLTTRRQAEYQTCTGGTQ